MYLFQLWSVFSSTSEIKNRSLIIIEPQAHKKLNLSLITRSIVEQNVKFCCEVLHDSEEIIYVFVIKTWSVG